MATSLATTNVSFYPSNHCIGRQGERGVTDKQIKKTIKYGKKELAERGRSLLTFENVTLVTGGERGKDVITTWLTGNQKKPKKRNKKKAKEQISLQEQMKRQQEKKAKKSAKKLAKKKAKELQNKEQQEKMKRHQEKQAKKLKKKMQKAFQARTNRNHKIATLAEPYEEKFWSNSDKAMKKKSWREGYSKQNI